ncbi:MAG: hypothetical protein ACK5PQ_04915 [Alphaproteobacteria bacterium]
MLKNSYYFMILLFLPFMNAIASDAPCPTTQPCKSAKDCQWKPGPQCGNDFLHQRFKNLKKDQNTHNHGHRCRTLEAYQKMVKGGRLKNALTSNCFKEFCRYWCLAGQSAKKTQDAEYELCKSCVSATRLRPEERELAASWYDVTLPAKSLNKESPSKLMFRDAYRKVKDSLGSSYIKNKMKWCKKSCNKRQIGLYPNGDDDRDTKSKMDQYYNKCRIICGLKSENLAHGLNLKPAADNF